MYDHPDTPISTTTVIVRRDGSEDFPGHDLLHEAEDIPDLDYRLRTSGPLVLPAKVVTGVLSSLSCTPGELREYHPVDVHEALKAAVVDSPRVGALVYSPGDKDVYFDGTHLVMLPSQPDAPTLRFAPLAPGEAPKHERSVHYDGHIWNEVDGAE
jgi:hypothetical protein